MHLPRDFFGCLGKVLEGVASLRREGIDNDSRKKTRQGRRGTCSAFPLTIFCNDACQHNPSPRVEKSVMAHFLEALRKYEKHGFKKFQSKNFLLRFFCDPLIRCFDCLPSVQNHRIRRNVSAHIILLCPLLHCHFRKKISHEIVSIGYFDVAKFDIKPYGEKTLVERLTSEILLWQNLN